MVKINILFLFIILGCTSGQDNDYLVITDCNIIDVINSKTIRNQDVVIHNSIIYYVGSRWRDKKRKGARAIDGHGKFIIPGLWDMHFHLTWEANNDTLLFPNLLAHGITGIRDMGGDLLIQQDFKNELLVDPSSGPEIYGAGPILDGDPPVITDFSLSLNDQSEIFKILDSLVALHADFFKVYSLLKESELVKIARYASNHQLSFAGHLSEYIEPEKSIGSGQKSIEHLNRLEEIWDTDSTRISQISELMRNNETWLCPTLITYYLKAHMNESSIEHSDYEKYIHPTLQSEWTSSRNRRIANSDWETLRKKFDKQLALVGFMAHKGVKILAGSDFAGMPYVYPGKGLHDELNLLHKAGLPNYEVIKSATIHPAIYFGIDKQFGSVTPGKFADLIVLDKNPIDNIQHTKSIRYVVKKGKLLDVNLSRDGTF